MLKTRIITGAILGIAITVTILFLPTAAVAVVFGVLWLAGAWEWASFARFTAAPRAAYVGVLLVGLLAACFAAGPASTTVLVVVASVWWVLALLTIVSYPRSFSPAAVALIGVVVLVPSWALMIDLHASGPLGPALAMTVLVIVWAADVGAYVAGRRLGRVKLAPKVSPGKTWEGVGGGVLLAAGAAWVAAQILGLPAGVLVVLGIATALVSVVGDLTVSLFKRNVGLKDSGRLLPGHGGVLDRIDSLTAAVPIFVLGLTLAGLR